MRYPKEATQRKADKIGFRYPRGTPTLMPPTLEWSYGGSYGGDVLTCRAVEPRSLVVPSAPPEL